MRIKSPVIFQLEATTFCNHKCIFCYNKKRRNVESETFTEPPLAVLKERIEILADAGILNLTITGGEPTLRNDIREIIEYASDIIPWVSLNTNGTYLERILDSPLPENVSLLISIRGTRRIHRIITGVNDFDKIIKNIRNAIHIGTKLTANFVPTRLNLKDLWNTACILKSVGVDTLYISRLIGNPDLQITRNDVTVMVKTLKNIERRLGFKVSLSTPYPICFLGDEIELNWIQGCACPWGTIYGGANVAGYVTPCPADGAATFLGNLHTRSLEDMWQRAGFLRQCIDSEKKKMCGSCELFEVCSHGCIAADHQNDPLMLTEEVKRLKKFSEKIKRLAVSIKHLKPSLSITTDPFLSRLEGDNFHLIFIPSVFCGLVNDITLDILRICQKNVTVRQLIELMEEKYYKINDESIRNMVLRLISMGIIKIVSKKT